MLLDIIELDTDKMKVEISMHQQEQYPLVKLQMVVYLYQPVLLMMLALAMLRAGLALQILASGTPKFQFIIVYLVVMI